MEAERSTPHRRGVYSPPPGRRGTLEVREWRGLDNARSRPRTPSLRHEIPMKSYPIGRLTATHDQLSVLAKMKIDEEKRQQQQEEDALEEEEEGETRAEQQPQGKVNAWEFLACEAVGIMPVARLDPNEGNAALRKRNYVSKADHFQPSRYAELASIPSFSELHQDEVLAPPISR